MSVYIDGMVTTWCGEGVGLVLLDASHVCGCSIAGILDGWTMTDFWVGVLPLRAMIWAWAMGLFPRRSALTTRLQHNRVLVAQRGRKCSCVFLRATYRVCVVRESR